MEGQGRPWKARWKVREGSALPRGTMPRPFGASAIKCNQAQSACNHHAEALLRERDREHVRGVRAVDRVEGEDATRFENAPHLRDRLSEKGSEAIRGDQKGSEGIRRNRKESEGIRRDQRESEGIGGNRRRRRQEARRGSRVRMIAC